jgi:hypothetical protein
MKTTKTTTFDEIDYEMELVDDSVNELKHGNPAYCFSKKQISEIQKRIPCTVKIEDGIYELRA